MDPGSNVSNRAYATGQSVSVTDDEGRTSHCAESPKSTFIVNLSLSGAALLSDMNNCLKR